MAPRTTPPFRADHVGSLLRTAPLKEARSKHAEKKITDAQLREVEDREIEKVIKKQEEVGLKLATDGEFRRSWWQFDFYKDLDNVELYTVGEGIKFAGVTTKAESVRVTGKVGFSSHPHVEHFKFVKAHTKVMPKMTIPAPSTLHFRQGRQSIDKKTYPELDAYFDDRCQGLPEGHPRVLRRRLPLSADGRHRLVDDLRSEGARAFEEARRRSGFAAGEIRGDDQQGAGGQARRHVRVDALLPRQFPLDLHRLGRLRLRSRASAERLQARRLLPGIRHRAGGRL